MPVANGASRTRQKSQKVIAAYAIYTKRCTTVPDFVLGVNRHLDTGLLVISVLVDALVANGASRTRQKSQKVIAAYAIYTKRCTTVPDFVLGVNRHLISNIDTAVLLPRLNEGDKPPCTFDEPKNITDPYRSQFI
ncbi:hypothetical protein T265_07852 [Opisthorchis viverrini]|uniref:Uncharacterized protein n=1 Tax=Opisthorchis viverrini TaxID=6198 RepID=A0A074ZB07_OPIVI|nr:hypothetical protein T265_07852 [Opisthorchis viverrini]KER24486.1 hypothetical protein T265_07852 [Opisthorchis viverrini]